MQGDVEVLWEPGNFQDDGAKRVGVCFASTDLELWTDGGAGRHRHDHLPEALSGGHPHRAWSQLQRAPSR